MDETQQSAGLSQKCREIPDGAEHRVNELAQRWIAERPRGVDLHESVATPAYQDIISMRERAVRPLLLRLRRKPEHWFHALHEITGENPVPQSAEGNLKLMTEAWLRWGRERGYLSELD